MAFDLYITISGLCLLARRSEELVVFLPRTHGNCKHFAVLGSHARYQPDRPAEAVNGFVEHHLGEQSLLLDFDTEHALDTHLGGYDIAELPKAYGPLKPEERYLQLILSDGSACPEGICRQEKGARWRYQEKNQNLATEVHWRVRDVTSEAEGKEGINVRVISPMNEAHEITFRPVNRQLRIYLFHTVADELPSNNPPAPKLLPVGEPAPHFSHYYSLLTQPECEPPILLPEEDEETTSPRKMFLHGHVGRRYSCVVAQFDDTTGA